MSMLGIALRNMHRPRQCGVPQMEAALLELLIWGDHRFTTHGSYVNLHTGAGISVNTIGALCREGFVKIHTGQVTPVRGSLARITTVGKDHARRELMKESEQLLSENPVQS